MTRRPLGWAAAVVLAFGLMAPAVAATTTAIGAWTFVGSPQSYAGTLQLPATGFPAGTFTSDSGSFGAIGIQTGASMWFGPSTPPGQVFGSSRNQPYLNVGTRSDRSASTTTYTFAAGTPTGWGLVLGDVDADQVQLSGTSASGAPLSSADLGFQSTFNMCATSPKPSGCGPNDTDVPTWNAGTRTLVGNTADTVGASGWFRPAVSVRTLTLTFSRLSGTPSYQTWFAVRMQDLTGTVAAPAGCDPTQARVALVGPDGTTLATATPDATGHYSFTGVAAGAGYVARLDAAPTGCVVSGAASVPVDLSSADATAGFAVVAAPEVTGSVHGSVKDTQGDPVAGAVLHLHGAVTERVETSKDGDYRLPPVPAGEYTITLDPPGDLVVVGDPTRHITVDATGHTPRLDFEVRHPAATTTASTSGTTTSGPTASGPITTASTTGALPEVGSAARWWVPLVGLVLLAGGVLVLRRPRGEPATTSRGLLR